MNDSDEFEFDVLFLCFKNFITFQNCLYISKSNIKVFLLLYEL